MIAHAYGSSYVCSTWFLDIKISTGSDLTLINCIELIAMFSVLSIYI